LGPAGALPERGLPYLPPHLPTQDIEALAPLEHGGIAYEDFQKDFYKVVVSGYCMHY
jgi:hypothetical protein